MFGDTSVVVTHPNSGRAREALEAAGVFGVLGVLSVSVAWLAVSATAALVLFLGGLALMVLSGILFFLGSYRGRRIRGFVLVGLGILGLELLVTLLSSTI